MKINEIKVLRGPNYWSIRRSKLIQMRLHLEDFEQKPTNKIDGFFMRVKDGTWMGHVIEHIALELQTLAGMDCGFGRTRGTGIVGEYFVVFDYMEEEAGKYAAQAAVKVAQALADGVDYSLDEDIQTLREIREDTRLGPSTGCIVEEAARRGIPFIRLNKQSLVQLGYGVHQKRIRATIASTTSNIAVDIASDKEETKNLLGAAQIPVPRGTVVRDPESLKDAVERFGYPLVIKPIDGNHGKGNTTNIISWEQALLALENAQY